MREEIKTARLFLRRFRESDYDDLFEFLSQLEDDEFEGYPGITYENGREHLRRDETNKLFREFVEENTLETERLFLREMNEDDYDALYSVLADSDIMQHYPYTFDEKRVRGWIAKNIDCYRIFGFGLWAVCLKDTGEMIGDCGLTLQNINGEILPEIGYHIRHDCQRKGYAREAAKAVRNWAFRNTDYPTLYSYCKYTNVPSIKTAESIGMHFECEYPDETNGTTHVSAISREEWLNEMTEIT